MSTPATRLRRISPTLAMLIGLGAPMFAAQDIDVTVSVNSTGQTQGGTLVTNAAAVEFTVTFSEDVFSAYFKPAAPGLASTATPAVGADIFDIFDFTGTAGGATRHIRQVNGKQFVVTVGGLTNDQVASLAIAADKMYDAGAGVDTNKAVAAKSVTSLQPGAGEYTLTISTAANYGFLNPVLIGTMAVTGKADPNLGDYVVKFKEGATDIGSTTTAADGTWFFSPLVRPSIGEHTFTGTPDDAAGNAAASAGNVTKLFYVWDAPTLATIEQTDDDTPAAFVDSMEVNDTKPAMTGLAGIPKTLTSSGVVQVTIDIFHTGTTNPAVAQIVKSGAGITAGASAAVDSAIWSIADSDYSTDLANGIYDVAINTKVITTNASPNSITTTKTFTVNTATATVPTLTVAGASTPNHKPVITIDGVGVEPTTSTIKMFVKKGAGAFVETAGTVASKAGGTATDVTWIPDVALTDGVYEFKAQWINAAGKVSADSSVVTTTVVTPTPVLAAGSNVTQGTAQADGNIQYLISNLTPKIAVTGVDPTKGTLEVYAISRGTNGTTAIDPYDITHSAIDGVVTDNDCIVGNRIDGTLAAGEWTPDDPFVAGRYSLVAKWTDNDDDNATGASATDAVSVPSNILNIRVLAAVTPPVFTEIGDANAVTSALPTSMNVTRASGAILLKGTGNPGATLKLKRNGVSLPTKVIANDGTWSYEMSADSDADSTAMPSGTNLITATQLDLSGTESVVTTQSLTINVSGVAPQAPKITSPVTGSKIADTTPLLKGTAPANSTVKIYQATTVSTAMAGANNDITLTARSHKAATITLEDPSANSAALSVSVTGTDITVSLATGSGGAITTTATQLASAINANTAAAALVRAAVKSGEDGSGVVTALAQTPIAASSVVAETTASSTGAWTKADLGTLKDNATAATVASLTAGAEPGTLYNLFATATSAAGIEGAGSTGVDVYVVTPDLDVVIAALDKGTGDDYGLEVAAVKGAATVKVVSETPNNGTILVGDYVTFAGGGGDTTEYKISAVNRTATGPDKYTLTISPGLKAARSIGDDMTIIANPNSPTSGKSSLSQILLKATFTSGGNPVDEIVSSLTAASFTVANGKVTTVTKGTGLLGNRPTNVWVLAVTPDVTENVNLQVSLAEGKVATQPGYLLNGFDVANVGSEYTAANTTFTIGGGKAAAISWVDGNTDGSIQAGELTIDDPGYGFTASPVSITVKGGPGSGAVVPTSIPFAAGAFTTGTYALTTQGTGYINGVAKVAFVGGGTVTTPAVATATVVAGKVTQIEITNGGSYSSRPTIIITSGRNASIKATTIAGVVKYNGDSNTYSQAIDRIKPVVTWKGAADTTAQLFNVAQAGSPAANTAITGVTYVNMLDPAASTAFKVRAAFSSKMTRPITSADLTVAGATVTSITNIDDDNADADNDITTGGDNQNFDILLTRGAATGTVMSVSVKAKTDLLDDATPRQANLASSNFVATIVGQPTAPVISSTVGALAPTVPARTSTYPCTVKFTAPVTGFTPEKLKVTNGVIAKFSGSGSTYNFTLVPGEGEVSVQYDSGLTPILDVAGNPIPSSNVLVRVLDSTQPLVAAVASPAFATSGAIKPQNGGAAYNKVAMRVTFTEAPKTFPATAVFATLASNGSQIALTAPAGSPGGATGPQVVADTGGKTWAFDLTIPASGSGKVNMVLPALLVPDQAGNQGAASTVYTIEYDHAGGTAVEMTASPVYSDG